MADFRRDLQTHADAVEALLLDLLPAASGPQARLHKAMRYATLDGGKRLRPFLVASGARMFNVPEGRSLRVGVAIELIHCYSLVHDDLPAMDDAPMRRGRPSCHAAFDEATAVLAGDALQSLAFEVLADKATHPDAALRLELVRMLAHAAGAAGMCGGQMIDLEAETRRFGFDETVHLQRLKTGALFRFASECGAVLAGASSPERAALAAYADDLGLAFQIKDDLLDVQGDPALAGKALGQDAEAGKATLVALLGVREAERRLSDLQASALHHLERFGPAAGPLRQLFAFTIGRSH
ncbi:MAG: polyprenyl synthetase family protein [Alphaproteobacteria bacterium]